LSESYKAVPASYHPPPAPYSSSFTSTASLTAEPTYIPDEGPLADAYVHRKADLHGTLHKVQLASKEVNRKIAELEAMCSSIALGFEPALESVALDSERLKSEIDRRRMLTESTIFDKISKLQAPIQQHLKLLQQQQVGMAGCSEIAKSALTLDPTNLIRAFPRIEIEARQILCAHDHMESLSMPKQPLITHELYPKNCLEGVELVNKKAAKRSGDKRREFEDYAVESDEKDEIIVKLVEAVEKLEILRDLKEEVSVYTEEQDTAVRRAKQSVRRSKRSAREDHLSDTRATTIGPSLALAGVDGGEQATRYMERRMKAAEGTGVKGYLMPTMSNYAKAKL
jgi:hypothetical protein